MEKNKVLFYYNPYSGDGKIKNALDEIVERFQAEGLQIIPVRTGNPDLLDKILKEIDEDDYRQIIVSGGDGTINSCVNAMVKNDIDLPLAILPTGTANDFASYFKMPTDLKGMIEVAVEAFIRRVDIGKCNDNYFVNVASVGDPVEISQATDTGLKNSLGLASYYLQGISEITNMKPHKVHIVADGKTYVENIFFILVLNGRSVGGFKQTAPHSHVDDGKFNVIVFREVSMLKFPAIFISALKGNLDECREVLSFEAADIVIKSEDDIPTDVDGEKGDDLPLHLSVMKERLQVIVPKANWERNIKKKKKMEEAMKVTEDYDKLYAFFEENGLETHDGISPTKPLKAWQIEEDGKIIGGTVLGKCEDDFILDGIAVDKDKRRSKIGQKLIDTLMEEAKKRGAKRLLLVAKVPGFFRANGFVEGDFEDVPVFFGCLDCVQKDKTCFPLLMKKDF